MKIVDPWKRKIGSVIVQQMSADAIVFAGVRPPLANSPPHKIKIRTMASAAHTSWVEGADAHGHFTIHNLPLVFSQLKVKGPEWEWLLVTSFSI
jgi:hypothetical protein